MLRLLLVTVLAFASLAEAASPIERYEALTTRRLSEARQAAVALQRGVETLFSEPNDATLESARLAWRHARNMFMMTEPLYLGEDAAGRDEVVAALTTAEQVLWGNDQELDAPGNRPLSDFISTEPEAARQKERLTAAITTIAQPRMMITVQWASPEAPRLFLTHLAATATKLANTHIEQPLASGDPRKEPSPYSDNTLEDLRYAIAGMQQVVAALKPDAPEELSAPLHRASRTARGIQAHMDYLITAPADHPERKMLQQIAADLRGFADAAAAVAER